MVRPHDETQGDETAEQIVDRHKRVRLLDALAMPVKIGHAPLRSDKNANNTTSKVPDTWRITVQCPAALGMVNCPLVQRADGLRDPDLPDVPNPPQVSHPNLLPRACRNDHATYRLALTHAKRLQPFTWGSHAWADAYRPIRASNERYHSQFKHGNSGGVRESWLEMRGIAKHGLLAAISNAVTAKNLISDFRTKHTLPDGTTQFGPREEIRRKRYQLLNARGKAPS